MTVDTAGLSPEATELANLLAVEIAHLPPEAVAELLGRLKILRNARERSAREQSAPPELTLGEPQAGPDVPPRSQGGPSWNPTTKPRR